MKTVFSRNTGTRESAESSDILIFWPFKGWFRDFLYTTQLKSLEMLYGQDPQLFAHGPSRTCGVQDPPISCWLKSSDAGFTFDIDRSFEVLLSFPELSRIE